MMRLVVGLGGCEKDDSFNGRFPLVGPFSGRCRSFFHFLIFLVLCHSSFVRIIAVTEIH